LGFFSFQDTSSSARLRLVSSLLFHPTFSPSLLLSAWYLLHHFCFILTHSSDSKLIVLCPRYVLRPKPIV
jgi:hypothetical protein